MDMAVASLFKHKIRFIFDGVNIDLVEPFCFKRSHYFWSSIIDSAKSLGVNTFIELYEDFCKPIVLHGFSRIIHEDNRIPIDRIQIDVNIDDVEERELHYYRTYTFTGPQRNPELLLTQSLEEEGSRLILPENLLSKPIRIFIEFACYYYCDSFPEEVRFRREFDYRSYWQNAYPLEEFYYLADRLEEEAEDNDNDDNDDDDF